ncbi:MAG: NarK/NasA family nitrate transporter [Acidobacteriia bacterium]|nr:NarK/NasA family nitrate transporter [Terriglobia bacterium]
MSSSTNAHDQQRALMLATLAFAVCFAVWGSISALAPLFKQMYALNARQISFLIAIPVLLGSTMRLPMGMLADRFGGRSVFSILLFFSVLPAVAIGFTHSFTALVLWAFLLGLAGTSFSIGVAFTSKWFPPERQGFALGVYGAGNIGQSVAVFGGPLLAAHWGWQSVYWIFGGCALLMALGFVLLARDAPRSLEAKTLKDSFQVLFRKPLSWVLSMFYFLTFGGFVALGIYLPTLLKDTFHLSLQDAGIRTAGFVLLATAMRPIGGSLSDHLGGSKILTFVFLGILMFSLGMTSSDLRYFRVGALGTAVLLGIGNGAVFKLVPQYFPQETGTVTGLVGAWGGLGGFFPPLVLGAVKDATGTYTQGFWYLSGFAFICLLTNYIVFQHKHRAAVATV